MRGTGLRKSAQRRLCKGPEATRSSRVTGGGEGTSVEIREFRKCTIMEDLVLIN